VLHQKLCSQATKDVSFMNEVTWASHRVFIISIFTLIFSKITHSINKNFERENMVKKISKFSAIVPVAGEGTRLRPHTHTYPKVL